VKSVLSQCHGPEGTRLTFVTEAHEHIFDTVKDANENLLRRETEQVQDGETMPALDKKGS
jgi:hypothetical protein